MVISYTKLKLASGLFAGLMLSISGYSVAYGAERESITLSPVSKRYELKAGEVRSDELTIINDGETRYDFTVYAQPYSVTNENYDPDFFNERDNTDIYKWIRPEKNRYTLAAGESITVTYTITVPTGARPGGHYGAVFAETQPAGDTRGNSVARKKRVGTIIYATVEGQYRTGGALKDISIPRFQLKSPLQTNTRVQNTGNTDFATDLALSVTDMFGSVKFAESKSYQVLPETTRKMTMQWANAPSFGLFKVSVTTKYMDEQTTKVGYTLMAPLGAYLVVILTLFAAIIFFVQKRH